MLQIEKHMIYIIFYLLLINILQIFKVSGKSMEKYIMNNDIVIIIKSQYIIHKNNTILNEKYKSTKNKIKNIIKIIYHKIILKIKININDILVLQLPYSKKKVIKRCIGIPGIVININKYRNYNKIIKKITKNYLIVTVNEKLNKKDEKYLNNYIIIKKNYIAKDNFNKYYLYFFIYSKKNKNIKIDKILNRYINKFYIDLNNMQLYINNKIINISIYIPKKYDKIKIDIYNLFIYKNVICNINNIIINNILDINNFNIICKENYYYIIGNNFYNSHDSRHYGIISESCIIGKMLFKI